MEIDVGHSLLAIASQRLSVDKARDLIAQGARVDARDAEGRTPLHLAMQGASTKVAAALIDAGAEVNSKDSKGNSPLHYAARMHERFAGKFIDFLVDRGADPNSANSEGQSPLFLSQSQQAEQALVRAGASMEHKDDRGRTAKQYVFDKIKTSVREEAGAIGSDFGYRESRGIKGSAKKCARIQWKEYAEELKPTVTRLGLAWDEVHSQLADVFIDAYTREWMG